MSEPDPFSAARAASRRTAVRGAVIAGVVVLVAILGFGVVELAKTRPPALPGPVVAALASTTFREPVDRATGWTRFAGALPDGVRVSAAAIGRDGTVALAFSRPGDVGDRVLAWKAGSFRVVHDTAAEITSLAVSPEGDTWVGTMAGGIVIVKRDGTLFPSAQHTSGTSIVRFAFDPASAKTAVLVAGGAVFTANRGLAEGEEPLRPGALTAVEMPPNARMRHVLYDADGDLVVAGGAGAVFVSTSSGWDDRTLAAVGDVGAIALDGDGELVAVQSSGHVWRRDGATWDAIGHVPHPPLAIGELPDRGLVVATDDGQLFAVTGEHDGALVPGYATTTDEPVFAAQVAGANVVFVSVRRVRIWDGATWDSGARTVTRPPGVAASGCTPVGSRSALSPDDAERVSCGGELLRVAPEGVAPATAAAPRADEAPSGGPSEEALQRVGCECTIGCVPPEGAEYRVSSAARAGASWIAYVDWHVPVSPEIQAMVDDGLADVTVQGGRLLARFRDAEPSACEPLVLDAPNPVTIDFESPTTRVIGAGDRALVLRPGVVALVPAEGAPQRFTLPAPGLVPVALWRTIGTVALSAHGDVALLADQGQRRRILRCHAAACRFVELPPRDEATLSVGLTADDHLFVVTGDHELALQTR